MLTCTYGRSHFTPESFYETFQPVLKFEVKVISPLETATTYLHDAIYFSIAKTTKFPAFIGGFRKVQHPVSTQCPIWVGWE